MSGNVYAQTQEQLNIYFSYVYLFVLLHKRIKVIHRIIFYMCTEILTQLLYILDVRVNLNTIVANSIEQFIQMLIIRLISNNYREGFARELS